MDERILFNPDNRLLGSSTGDLGLYGGQTDPNVDIHALREGDSTDLDPAPSSDDTAGVTAPDGNAGGIALAPGYDPLSSQTDVAASLTAQSLLTAPGAFQTVTVPVHSETVQPSAVDSFPSAVPQPAGSGAPTPQLQPSDTATHGDTAAPIVHALDLPVLSQAEPAVTLVTTTVENVTALAGNVLDGVAATTGPVINAVEQLTDTVGGLVTTTVPTTVDSVDHLAVHALEGLAETSGAVTDAFAPTIDSASDTVTTTVGAVTDTLADLAGSNPEGGIATLVSLVSAADMFDLQPTDAPVAEAADSGLGFDLLDTLADHDAALGSLLGGDAHHDGASGAFDTHGDAAHPLGL